MSNEARTARRDTGEATSGGSLEAVTGCDIVYRGLWAVAREAFNRVESTAVAE